MAHYLLNQEKLGSPFKALRELKMIIPHGAQRRQISRYPKLLLVLGGSGEVRMRDGFHAVLKEGDALIVPKPCHHGYTSPQEGQDGDLYVFLLFLESVARPTRRLPRDEAEWHRMIADLFCETRHLPAILDASLYALLQAFREEHRSSQIGSLLKQKGIARDLVIELARRCAAAPVDAPPLPYRSHARMVHEVREYLVKTLHRPHSLSEIAWRFHLSEEHLARLFKKETGSTVMAFLRTLRIQRARHLLLGSNETIANLAQRCGFSSSNHFCRSFVAVTGHRPMEYRETYSAPPTAMSDPATPPQPRKKPARKHRHVAGPQLNG